MISVPKQVLGHIPIAISVTAKSVRNSNGVSAWWLLIKANRLVMTEPDNPRSPSQKYVKA